MKDKRLSGVYYGGLGSVAKELVRVAVKALYKMAGGAVCRCIYAVTKESHVKDGDVTVRKVRRIRRLTAFKIRMYGRCKRFFRYIGEDGYFENLKKRIGYGM